MKCPGCGAEVENERVAHYHKDDPPAPDAEAAPDAAPNTAPDVKPDPPPETKPEGKKWDFSTPMFD